MSSNSALSDFARIFTQSNLDVFDSGVVKGSDRLQWCLCVWWFQQCWQDGHAAWSYVVFAGHQSDGQVGATISHDYPRLAHFSPEFFQSFRVFSPKFFPRLATISNDFPRLATISHDFPRFSSFLFEFSEKFLSFLAKVFSTIWDNIMMRSGWATSDFVLTLLDSGQTETLEVSIGGLLGLAWAWERYSLDFLCELGCMMSKIWVWPCNPQRGHAYSQTGNWGVNWHYTHAAQLFTLEFVLMLLGVIMGIG